MGFRKRKTGNAYGVRVSACALLFAAVSSFAQSPASAQAQTQQPAATAQAPAEPAGELATREAQPTFKVRVNVVLVRVVARDNQGRAIGTLHKEDFRLFDRGKPQVITSFAVETPGSRSESSRAIDSAANIAPQDEGKDDKDKDAPVLPERYAALLFDDLDLSIQDVLQSRSAAVNFLDALQPSDRVALFTTSGQSQLDFTDDHAKLSQMLQVLIPHPLVGNIETKCPDVSFYEADLIINQNDSQAFAAATEDTIHCAFQDDRTQYRAAQAIAQAAAQQALTLGEESTIAAFRRLDEVIRRMTVLPGQRTIVLVSPGFLVTFATHESTEVIDRATRGNVLINAIDARGLYTIPPGGDIASPVRMAMRTAGIRETNRVAAQTAQAEVMRDLTSGTGGTFFHNRNDLGEGMRLLAAAPEFSYVLGFSPQNLKLDGSYHQLRVTLANKEKYELQARRGYYAPKGARDPAEAARKDIEEAIFSQEEMRDLPVELQTQYFKKNEENASLAVLTRVDLKGLRFRKAEGRNRENLTVATAIFDENGNLVTGNEKIVEMKLRDTTLERLGRAGFTVKSSFDVKPGTYMVRLVVRDSEAEQMAARSSAVKIPF